MRSFEWVTKVTYEPLGVVRVISVWNFYGAYPRPFSPLAEDEVSRGYGSEGSFAFRPRRITRR
jgi:hypothetical protein